jgi:hypothetical protein
MEIKLSKYIVISEALGAPDDPRTERIIFSTRTAKGIKVTNFAIDLIQSGRFDLLPDRLFTIFMYHEIIIPACEDETETVIQRKLLTSKDIAAAVVSVLIDAAKEPVTGFSERLSRQLEALTAERMLTAGFSPLTVQISLLINDYDHGFTLLEQIQSLLKTAAWGQAADTDLQLIIDNRQLSRLAEYIPLNNTGFNRINFLYDDSLTADADSLAAYLVQLAGEMQQGPALAKIPAGLWLHLHPGQSVNVTLYINVFKRLAANRNLKIHICFASGGDIAAEKKLQQQEFEFIQTLSRNGIQVHFLPIPDNRYRAENHITPPYKAPANGILNISNIAPKENNLFAGELFTSLPGVKDNELRLFYSGEFAGIIRSGSSMCTSCVYLPLCGGRVNKLPGTTEGCPSFTRNFIKKVQYMYNFSLES